MFFSFTKIGQKRIPHTTRALNLEENLNKEETMKININIYTYIYSYIHIYIYIYIYIYKYINIKKIAINK